LDFESGQLDEGVQGLGETMALGLPKPSKTPSKTMESAKESGVRGFKSIFS
jgi:hypothetical protein